MFCKQCGKENTDDSNYCSHDGSYLAEVNSAYKNTKEETNFCGECGEKTPSYANYCESCGGAIYVEDKLDRPNKFTREAMEEDTKTRAINIKSILLSLGIGMGVMLLLGLLVSGMANSIINEEISKQAKFAVNIKLLNTFDILLLLNGVKLNLVAKLTKYSSGKLNLVGLPVIVLLIPFIIYFIIGFKKSRNDMKAESSVNIKDILFTSILYGLLIMIFGFLNSEGIGFGKFLGGGLSFNKKYGALMGFVNGFFISGVSILAGYAVSCRLKKDRKALGDYSFIFDGVYLMLVGLIITSLVGLILSLAMGGILGESGIFELSQLGVYIFLFLNFGVYSNGIKKKTVSLIKNSEVIVNAFGKGRLILLWGLVLIPIILFFLYGKKNRDKSLDKIIYTSLAYSIALGALAHVSYIYVAGTGHIMLLGDVFSKNINMGFKSFPVFIGGFILSTISALAGYFIFRKKEEILEEKI